nr:protein MIX23 isoform X4 [Equus asinus]
MNTCLYQKHIIGLLATGGPLSYWLWEYLSGYLRNSQAASWTPLLRADWLAAGASRLSNMAAPSGGVNCEEFAEFQVMGFSSCDRRVPPFVPAPYSCFDVGGSANQLREKRATQGITQGDEDD